MKVNWPPVSIVNVASESEYSVSFVYAGAPYRESEKLESLRLDAMRYLPSGEICISAALAKAGGFSVPNVFCDCINVKSRSTLQGF